jgi:Ca2+:H+ antiporter
VVALLVSGAEVLGGGRGGYGKTLRGLAWYIGWPFGKYVEGEGAPEDSDDSDEEDGDETVRYGASDNGSPTSRHRNRHPSDGASSGITVRDTRRAVSGATQASGEPASAHPQRAATTISFAPSAGHDDERVPLIRKAAFRRPRNKKARILGRIIYWPLFVLVVAPIMLFVCLLCWGLVFTIPMAKLTWVLIKLLATRPLEINFRAAPRIAVQHTPSGSPGSLDGSGDTTAVEDSSPSGYIMKQARLKAGQVAPTA